MRNTVVITVLTGPHKNRRFCFPQATRCTVGRACDCLVQLTGDERDCTISRHHCRLDIDLPRIQLRDLGSLNGTYLNGRKLERLEPALTDATALPEPDEAIAAVEPGDVVTLGGTSLRISLVECPLAAARHDDSPEWSENAAMKQDCPVPC
jgi:pSer/pThr/pTyr-binding forkhead associated (FHA) protein